MFFSCENAHSPVLRSDFLMFALLFLAFVFLCHVLRQHSLALHLCTRHGITKTSERLGSLTINGMFQGLLNAYHDSPIRDDAVPHSNGL